MHVRFFHNFKNILLKKLVLFSLELAQTEAKG